NWYASFLMALAAGLSLLIYSLRRHRVDDYHGRYRIWLWAALVCMLLSIEQAADVCRIGHALLAPLAQRCGITDELLWTGSCAVLLTYVSLRVLLEVRRSRLATLLFVVAGAGFATRIGEHFGWTFGDTPQHRLMFDSGARLLAQLGLA